MDFVFLPRDVPHSYAIKTDGPVHLLVIAITREEDGRRFGRDIEENGERVTTERLSTTSPPSAGAARRCTSD